ncbi:MAG: spore germination protein [Limnochordaceae bacterium]|nr:spore germination protein [Limnochordaceae bacterium]
MDQQGSQQEKKVPKSAAENVKHPLSPSLDKNLAILKQQLGYGKSFDIILQQFDIAGHAAAILCINGLIDDVLVQREVLHLIKLRAEQWPQSEGNAGNGRDAKGSGSGEAGNFIVTQLQRRLLGYYQVSVVETIDEVIDKVLVGPWALLLDGDAHALILDMRRYPARSVEEPDLERVTRGARDGFTEVMLTNTALLRRRLHDPRLRFEALTAGRRGKTQVVLAYLEDIVRPGLVEKMRRRIEAVDTDGLPMGVKSLEEYVTGIRLNPLPIVRYTERPDVTAAHLLEGHLVVLVDNTPQVMILPVTAWHFTQHAEEYFQAPSVGTYLRWIRFFGFFISFLLVPLWLGIVRSVDLFPQSWHWIGPKGPVGVVPLLGQFLIIELGLDLTRQAFIHTPTPLASSLGIVAAVLLGQFAVQTGLLVKEVLLYSSVAFIGFFAIPNMEFGIAVRMLRYLAIIPAGLWGIWGTIGGLTVIFLFFAFTRSFGLPYLWPLIPFNGPALLRIIFRAPVPMVGTRLLPGVQDTHNKPPQ